MKMKMVENKTKCQKVEQQVVSVGQHCDLCAWKWLASDMKYQKSRALESLESTTTRTRSLSLLLASSRSLLLALSATFSDPDASFAPRRKRSAARAGGGRVEASPVAKRLQFSCQLNLWASAIKDHKDQTIYCVAVFRLFFSLLSRIFIFFIFTFISSNTTHVRQKPWETMPKNNRQKSIRAIDNSRVARVKPP